MKYTIAETMNQLRADHRNLVVLLDILDVEAARLGSQGEPDYSLVADIMAYMAQYSDTVHHPKEDLIYEHIHAHHKDIEQGLAHIKKDHNSLEKTCGNIREIVESIEDARCVNREALGSALENYSKSLRTHMYWEEKELFKLADSLVDDEAWTVLLSSKGIKPDPLFGNKVERRFRKLFSGIQQRIVWDNQQYFM